MNFFFIIDTSFSMMQVCNHYSLLDLAKTIVERFTDVRVKHHQESKFDRYFMSSTCQTEYDIIPYSLPHDSYIFNVNLKTLLISHQNNPAKSLVRAFNILNDFRLLYGHDNFLGGRDPFKTDTSIVVFITDGSSATFVDTLNEAFRSDFSFNRWDQQFFTFLLNPLDTSNKNLKNRQAPKNYSKILDFCQSMNGDCLVLNSPDTIVDFVDTFSSRLKHKISMNLHKINLENYKYDNNIQPLLSKLPVHSNPKLDQENAPEADVKTRLIVRLSTGHLSSKYSVSHANTVTARYPFPEDPYYMTPGKFVQKLNIDFSYESESSYPSTPLYYIDFTKHFSGKLSFDFPLERFEVDSGSELYNFVCEYAKGFANYNKIVFPVFFNNQYGNKQAAKMELFALLRYVYSELDKSVGLEFLVYPLNFPVFNEIWEDALKYSGVQPKGRPEFSPELTQKLEVYFDRTPFYYSNYLFALFAHKKLGDYINRKWKFSTNFLTLNQMNTDPLTYQVVIKNYIPEKSKKKQEYDLKVNSLKVKKNANPEEIIAENRRAIQRAKNERLHTPGATADQDKVSLINRVLSLKEELFSPKAQEAGPRGENLCSKPMSKMSNYHEYMSKFVPLKNPHEDDTERKFYKEAIPFGNPFKFVVRPKQSSMTDNYEDEAFLTSFNKLPGVEKSKSSRGVSPQGPTKPVHDPNKEKHRLSTSNFNLRSLQNALEERSIRSAPSSPGGLSTSSTVYSIDVPEMPDIKIREINPKANIKDKAVSEKTKAPPKMRIEEEKQEKPKESKAYSPFVENTPASSKKKVNPQYFMVCNATVFRDFAIFLKDPPKPTPKIAVDDHIRHEGLRILENLEVKNMPEVIDTVIKKLEDMMKVHNYQNCGFLKEYKRSLVYA